MSTQVTVCGVLQLHIVKNYMADKQAFDSQTKVPLILGIWGPKGQGKSFQCELVFKKMGCVPSMLDMGCIYRCIFAYCLCSNSLSDAVKIRGYCQHP